MYQFFSRLVDQYKELLEGATVAGGRSEQARTRQLEANTNQRFTVLSRAKQRAEWVKYVEQQKQKKEEEEEAEKRAYAEIDWHDFVVVETIEFTEADEHSDLPPPPSLGDLQSASLEQKAAMSLRPHNMRIEEAMPTADDAPLFEAPAPVQPPQGPPSVAVPYVPQPPELSRQSGMSQEAEEEQQRIREREEARERAQQVQQAAKGNTGPMRIRNDYVPRAQAKQQKAAMALCPNCKQQIPYDELERHMRIELLDPRWKEEKQKSEQRYATTNLSTADVANNLKRLASQRSDVFDASVAAQQQSNPQLTEDEEARRKRQATAVFYDGQEDAKDPARMQQMQKMNINEQIRHIHERYNK